MTPNDRVTGFIRTAVPYAVGSALAFILASTGADLSGEFEVALVAFGIVVAQNVYYLAVRLLERVLPGVGVLLGIPRTPDYEGVSNLWASVVRTGIPTIVGALVVIGGAAAAAGFGVQLDSDTLLAITALAVPVVQAAYYAAARAVIERWPASGILLGTAEQPIYLES